MQESGASWHEFFLVDSAVPNNLQLEKFNQVTDPRFKYSLSLKGALVVARRYDCKERAALNLKLSVDNDGARIGI